MKATLLRGAAATALVLCATGDPRDLDLPLSVEDLQALAADPRVDATTPQDAVDQGRRLDYWRG